MPKGTVNFERSNSKVDVAWSANKIRIRQNTFNWVIIIQFMTLYVCNTKSKIVHNAILETRRCKLEEIKTEERELFTSLIKAIMQGYTACPHCIGNTRWGRGYINTSNLIFSYKRLTWCQTNFLATNNSIIYDFNPFSIRPVVMI